jgi:hypothetical protein
VKGIRPLEKDLVREIPPKQLKQQTHELYSNFSAKYAGINDPKYTEKKYNDTEEVCVNFA